MRILWVKTELLHPVDKGGRIRSYQMLRSLSRKHHVTYLCLDDGRAAPDALLLAREYCAEVVTIPFQPTPKSSPAFALALLRNIFSRLPYAVARYRSDRQRSAVVRLSAAADLVVCDFLFPSQNIPDDLNITKILFQHNVEAVIWQRHTSVAQNFFRRAYMREQWRRMKRFERAECNRFDHVIAVSQADAATMRTEYGVDTVSSVQTGVDFEYFMPPSHRPRANHEIVFVGAMDWMPNEDGIRWFVEEVFGHVRARVPQTTLVVVGRSPSAPLRRLADRATGIEITGAVPDVRPYLSRAAVAIVPLRIGGGTRLKIYEAMAMGIPVVSTTVGAEGLPVLHGEHLLITDTPVAQADAIASLLLDRALADRLSANALRFVQEHCNWDAVAEQFLAQCLTVHNFSDTSYKDLVA